VSVSRLIPLLLLVLFVGALVYWNRHTAQPSGMVSHGNVTLPTNNCPAFGASLPSFLPPEACATLTRIMHNGPFPYSQDGVVFNNYEGLLPPEPRGFYHEYTVDTPGEHNRGTRRIITGGTPPSVFYYTGDHYHSFQLIQVYQ